MLYSSEHDELNVKGVRPADDMDSIRQYSRIPDGARQVVDNAAIADGTTTAYTVTDGKILYLCTAVVGVRNLSAGNGTGYIYIYTNTAAVWFRLMVVATLGHTSIFYPISFNPPLEIPEKYYFVLHSNIVNYATYLNIHGFEI